MKDNKKAREEITKRKNSKKGDKEKKKMIVNIKLQQNKLIDNKCTKL